MTQRELNRAVLARQLLLERSELALPRALEQVAGIQAQYAPSMYIGLWSRLAGFDRDSLTGALEDRSAIQATLMRCTIHLVSREDYWPLEVGVRDDRRAWFLRVRKDLDDAGMRRAAKRLRRELASAGTLRRNEIEALIGKQETSGINLWLDIVRAPPSGTWERRRADLYAAAEDWLGPPSVTREDGIELLVRRYLGAFGPATRAEIANFTGLPARAITPALERIETRTFRGPDGAKLLDLPGAPLPDADTPAPVRFIPTWDANLLVHCRRAQILPEEYRPRIFGIKTPQSFPTFLVDGAVAGTWRFSEGRVELSPFGRLDASVRRELDAEAERLAAFHA